MNASISLHVNGIDQTLIIEPRVSLLDALRDHLGLTGTKKGCAQGACGSCTVLVDGERINSCLALAVQYEGRAIVTIEGLADLGMLHPLQQAFTVTENGASPNELSDAELRERMSGNLCRCGAYIGIREAIQQVYGARKP